MAIYIGDKVDCIGCRWRMPRQFGGEGILCRASENGARCPEWVIKMWLYSLPKVQQNAPFKVINLDTVRDWCKL